MLRGGDGPGLAAALRALGITQERIARGLAMDRSTVSRALAVQGGPQWPLIRERLVAILEGELAAFGDTSVSETELRRLRRRLLGGGVAASYVGRDQALRELAGRRLATGAPLLLCGPCGIGKTTLLALLSAQLTAEGWHVHRQELKQRQFVPVSAGTPVPRHLHAASLAAACRNLASALGGGDAELPPVEALVAALGGCRDDVCLILDSVEEAPLDEAVPLLRRLAEALPLRANLLLILVSRTQDLYYHGVVPGPPFVLGELERAAAREIWERRAGEARTADFERAFARTKGHPLALMLLADLLCRYGPARFAQALAFQPGPMEQLIEYEYATVWRELSADVQAAFLLWAATPLTEEFAWEEAVEAFQAVAAPGQSAETWLEELIGRHFLLPRPASPGRYYAHALAVNAVRATHGFATLAG